MADKIAANKTILGLKGLGRDNVNVAVGVKTGVSVQTEVQLQQLFAEGLQKLSDGELATLQRIVAKISDAGPVIDAEYPEGEPPHVER
jgi:hypothetical protein